MSTGGVTTSGGSSGTGGTLATGGTIAAGGTLGSGGVTATGGTTGTGGRTGSGGGPGASGGSNSSGGTSATGGSTTTVPRSGGATGRDAGPDGSGTGGTGTGGTGGGAGGSTAPTTSACSGTTASSGDVTVNLGSLLQKISGFGASTAWASRLNATGDADLLWSTTTGAGLSLHRIRIDTTGTGTRETNIAKQAITYGVTIWATPWTPPPADKDNNNTVMGHLSNGQDFATKLATFVSNMKTAGIPIYAVSAQNEPDANVTYESCVYTGDTIASFVGNYMGPALSGTVKIMAPETQNWCGFKTMWPLIKANTTAMGYIDIIATHEYGCSATSYPDIAQAGKEFWETEIYDTNAAASTGIDSGLRTAQLIHDALTIANMNAWHYWWVYASDGKGGLFNNNTPTKRLWVEGNYSRFVRPGFQRASTSGSVANVLLTAFKSPSDGTVVVVAANKGTSAANLSVFVSGAAPCTMTPYVTSSSQDLAAGTAIAVSNGRFSASLAAQSVTTFVGKP